MTSKITLRSFKECDLNRVLEIEKQSFDYEYPDFLIKSLHSKCPDGFLVALDENNYVLGYIITVLEWGNAHVVSIAVDKEYRHQGIGNLLLDSIENHFFKVYNAKHIVLEVRFTNAVARKFYYKRGYSDRKILYNYYEDGSDAILMIKKRKGLLKDYPIYINMW
ncbi:ribosomal protein S18-alanine N-acetyltransferase [Methanococcus voltae]|uniref:Ribosomal-protein-alanine N-acetyltransferase n=2 Tax=Methanococcus voltae TaxID=2188 RepID=A0A8J7S4W9_METVO|nr:ribosomal protein S18-alanine N-acetyltransferase [Methanococcus voltae]MBP2172523.1 ribosomal-protein-alanine N-acetyltransferase [Methanococcus voltae]MBP2201570.1 ribosomal-protein-alanine N-acetyltransferase [Methanococcus voltae]MCS3922359.1 ribosomal-protein-alanine N-acetyltransferase [Methanococcus voltae PS]